MTWCLPSCSDFLGRFIKKSFKLPLGAIRWLILLALISYIRDSVATSIDSLNWFSLLNTAQVTINAI